MALEIAFAQLQEFYSRGLFFLFCLKNKDCGYSLEPPHQGGSDEHPQSMLRGKLKQACAVLKSAHRHSEVETKKAVSCLDSFVDQQ